jgi:hypothetical protein
LQREPGLANTAHTHDRDEPRGPHTLGHVADLDLATHEAAQLVRQVRAVGVERPQGWE